MNILNVRTMLTYLIVAGLAAFLLRAALSAVFIAPVPMDRDWCKETWEVAVSDDDFATECFAFKNDLEEAKFHYNRSIASRNWYLLTAPALLVLSMTYLLFYFIPKWRGTTVKGNTLQECFAVSLIAAFVIPLVYSVLLPAPATWLPAVFLEINDAQVAAKMIELRVQTQR